MDDEPGVCWALATFLRTRGYVVQTAAGGSDALRCLKESPSACDLVLIDAKLPDVEGVDLAKRIRAETACIAPMIMVSGYFYRDDRVIQDSLRSGLISAFVTKPFRHEEIATAIITAMGTGSDALGGELPP